jgi:hypothetical protein
MGRPGWGTTGTTTDSAVEAQAQALISQPQRVGCREGSAPCDARSHSVAPALTHQCPKRVWSGRDGRA